MAALSPLKAVLLVLAACACCCSPQVASGGQASVRLPSQRRHRAGRAPAQAHAGQGAHHSQSGMQEALRLMAWTPASPGRMKLWYQSFQQCAWLSTQPNHFLQQQQQQEGAGGASVQGPGASIYRPPLRPGPYLSIIITTQNRDSSDQHFRLSHFINNMAAYSVKYNLTDQVELILVDYNSDPTLPPLWEVESMKWPAERNRMPLVRVITVPHHLHKVVSVMIKSFSDPQFWQFQAKNLAMRRACGQYQLMTNTDVWLTDGFWQMVAKKGFKPDMLYRMGRVDTKPGLTAQSLEWSMEELEKQLVKHTEEVCGPNTFEAEGGGGMWLFKGARLRSAVQTWLEKGTLDPSETIDKGNSVVIGCPGDFTLMHRDAVMAVRGYPEMPLPTQLDDVILIQAANLGMHTGLLPAPAVMFHIEHPKLYNAHAQEVWDHVDEKVDAAFGMNVLQETKTASGKDKVILYNDETWGMWRHDLPEHYV